MGAVICLFLMFLAFLEFLIFCNFFRNKAAFKEYGGAQEGGKRSGLYAIRQFKDQMELIEEKIDISKIDQNQQENARIGSRSVCTHLRAPLGSNIVHQSHQNRSSAKKFSVRSNQLKLGSFESHISRTAPKSFKNYKKNRFQTLDHKNSIFEENRRISKTQPDWRINQPNNALFNSQAPLEAKNGAFLKLKKNNFFMKNSKHRAVKSITNPIGIQEYGQEGIDYAQNHFFGSRNLTVGYPQNGLKNVKKGDKSDFRASVSMRDLAPSSLKPENVDFEKMKKNDLKSIYLNYEANSNSKLLKGKEDMIEMIHKQNQMINILQGLISKNPENQQIHQNEATGSPNLHNQGSIKASQPLKAPPASCLIPEARNFGELIFESKDPDLSSINRPSVLTTSNFVYGATPEQINHTGTDTKTSNFINKTSDFIHSSIPKNSKEVTCSPNPFPETAAEGFKTSYMEVTEKKGAEADLGGVGNQGSQIQAKTTRNTAETVKKSTKPVNQLREVIEPKIEDIEVRAESDVQNDYRGDLRAHNSLQDGRGEAEAVVGAYYAPNSHYYERGFGNQKSRKRSKNSTKYSKGGTFLDSMASNLARKQAEWSEMKRKGAEFPKSAKNEKRKVRRVRRSKSRNEAAGYHRLGQNSFNDDYKMAQIFKKKKFPKSAQKAFEAQIEDCEANSCSIMSLESSRMRFEGREPPRIDLPTKSSLEGYSHYYMKSRYNRHQGTQKRGSKGGRSHGSKATGSKTKNSKYRKIIKNKKKSYNQTLENFRGAINGSLIGSGISKKRLKGDINQFVKGVKNLVKSNQNLRNFEPCNRRIAREKRESAIEMICSSVKSNQKSKKKRRKRRGKRRRASEVVVIDNPYNVNNPRNQSKQRGSGGSRNRSGVDWSQVRERELQRRGKKRFSVIDILKTIQKRLK